MLCMGLFQLGRLLKGIAHQISVYQIGGNPYLRHLMRDSMESEARFPIGSCVMHVLWFSV